MGDEARSELILASGSAGRAGLLRQAGIVFRQLPAEIDERALEEQAKDLDSGGLALMLAEAKARAVSRLFPEALVVGADQVIECCGEIFHKPPSAAAAAEQLRRLRGRAHSLHAGVCVARRGDVQWRHLGLATLTMRDFSDAFLTAYCQGEDEAVLRSVGAYRIEGRGIQLFALVEGDHSTIIGLPLLPLLGYLRQSGWLME